MASSLLLLKPQCTRWQLQVRVPLHFCVTSQNAAGALPLVQANISSAAWTHGSLLVMQMLPWLPYMKLYYQLALVRSCIRYQLSCSFMNIKSCRHNCLSTWTDFAYTDGSCRQLGGDWPIGSPGLGAAVYMPASCSLEDDIEIPILPCGPQSMHNTINRAELIGIMEAIKRKACNIATDSLTSMFQIRKQLRRPQDQTDHQHSSLLEEAARIIENNNEKVTLYKVKGHSCLMGNEKADEIAVGVAKGHIPEES